jgi:hypothetical protein
MPRRRANACSAAGTWGGHLCQRSWLPHACTRAIAYTRGRCTKPPRCVVVVVISNASRQDRAQLSRAHRRSRRLQRLRGALPRASTSSGPTVLLGCRPATPKQDGTTLGVSPTREVCATASMASDSERECAGFVDKGHNRRGPGSSAAVPRRSGARPRQAALAATFTPAATRRVPAARPRPPAWCWRGRRCVRRCPSSPAQS